MTINVIAPSEESVLFLERMWEIFGVGYSADLGDLENAILIGQLGQWGWLLEKDGTNWDLALMAKEPGSTRINWGEAFDLLRELGISEFSSDMLEATSYKRLVETLPQTGATIVEDLAEKTLPWDQDRFHSVTVSL